MTVHPVPHPISTDAVHCDSTADAYSLNSPICLGTSISTLVPNGLTWSSDIWFPFQQIWNLRYTLQNFWGILLKILLRSEMLRKVSINAVHHKCYCKEWHNPVASTIGQGILSSEYWKSNTSLLVGQYINFREYNLNLKLLRIVGTSMLSTRNIQIAIVRFACTNAQGLDSALCPLSHSSSDGIQQQAHMAQIKCSSAVLYSHTNKTSKGLIFKPIRSFCDRVNIIIHLDRWEE